MILCHDGDEPAIVGVEHEECVTRSRGMIRAELAFATPRKLPKATAVKGRVVGKTIVLRITTFNDQTTTGINEELKKGHKPGEQEPALLEFEI